MKKRRNLFANLLPFLLILLIWLGTLSVNADVSETPETTPESEDQPIAPTNTVSLTAPDTIRAGDTVEFTFHCDGEEIRAIQGSLLYDPTLLTYQSSEVIPSDWKITFSEEDGKLKYLGLSTENRGIIGNTPLFTLTFQVSENAPTDSQLHLSASDTTVYNGSDELILAGGEFSFTVARPLSNDCTLTALSIKGGNLSPAFSPEITEYSVKLPYTSHLAEISATACQYGKLKYGSRDLAVGENKVTVTVISETGLQQVYTITVTRAADPNYIPSSDNRILKMNLSDGLLFPAFSPEITEYTVYMVQGYDIFLSPVAAPKAIADGLYIRGEKSPESTDESPTAGSYTIICYAEDGTARTYTFRTILLSTPKQLEEVRRQNEEPNYLVPMVIGIVVFVCATVFFLGFVMGNVRRAKKKKSGVMAAAPTWDAPSPIEEIPTTDVPPPPSTEETAPKPAEESDQPTPSSHKKGKNSKKKKKH